MQIKIIFKNYIDPVLRGTISQYVDTFSFTLFKKFRAMSNVDHLPFNPHDPCTITGDDFILKIRGWSRQAPQSHFADEKYISSNSIEIITVRSECKIKLKSIPLDFKVCLDNGNIVKISDAILKFLPDLYYFLYVNNIKLIGCIEINHVILPYCATLKCSMFKAIENKNMCKRIVEMWECKSLYKDKMQCLKYLKNTTPAYDNQYCEIIPNIPMEHYYVPK